MNDLISRQAAIDAIRAMQTYKLFAGDDLILVDQAGAQTELMMLPSAKPRWIPVTERLPEENLPVLVAVKQKDRLPKWVKEQTHSYVTDIDVYDDGGFYTHKNNVVAWMPLPEPYREEGQND